MRRGALAVALLLTGSVGSAQAASGDLDAGYGTGGLATCRASASPYYGYGGLRIAAYRDGSVVLATVTPEGWLELCRVDPVGLRAIGFGTDGQTALFTGAGRLGDVVPRPDGGLLVALDARPETPRAGIRVYALTADGRLDRAFGGGDGLVKVSGSSAGTRGAAQLVRLGDGRLRLAFDRGPAHGWRFVGLTPTGARDVRFNDGRVRDVSPQPGGDVAERLLDLRVLPGGRTVLAGVIPARRLLVGLVRVGKDGEVLRSGRRAVRSPLPPVSGFDPVIEIERTGHLLLAANQAGEGFDSSPGGSTTRMWTARLRPDGSRDPKYGRRGVGRSLSYGEPFSGRYPDPNRIVRLRDGRIAVGGSLNADGLRNVESYFLLARLTADGRADRTFGVRGSVLSGLGDGLRGSYDNGQPNAVANDMVVLSDGRAVLGGSVYTRADGTVPAAARYLGVGSG